MFVILPFPTVEDALFTNLLFDESHVLTVLVTLFAVTLEVVCVLSAVVAVIPIPLLPIILPLAVTAPAVVTVKLLLLLASFTEKAPLEVIEPAVSALLNVPVLPLTTPVKVPSTALISLPLSFTPLIVTVLSALMVTSFSLTVPLRPVCAAITGLA